MYIEKNTKLKDGQYVYCEDFYPEFIGRMKNGKAKSLFSDTIYSISDIKGYYIAQVFDSLDELKAEIGWIYDEFVNAK